MFMKSNILTLPTILTLIRLVVSPLALPFLLINFLPLRVPWLSISLSCLVALLSLTDFFDGFFARWYNQTTSLGRILDPIADKFLLGAALISLTVLKRVDTCWVAILIGRETMVTGLRLVAQAYGVSVQVSKLAKWKTTVQMIWITTIVAHVEYSFGFHYLVAAFVEHLLLYLTLSISMLSAIYYYRQFNRLVMKKEERGAA